MWLSCANAHSFWTCAFARGAVEDLAVALERLALTLDGQVFSQEAARLVQVSHKPHPLAARCTT